MTKGQIVDGVEGIISDGIDILLAQIERYRIQERFARGKLGKITGAGGREPRILGHSNNPPYGYRYHGTKAERQLVIVEEEAKIVVIIYLCYVVEHLSMQKIADRLTAMHIPTPSDGGRNVAQHLRGPCEWSKTSVGRILHGEVYIGTMYHNKYKRAHKSTKVINRPKEAWIGVSVPAIVEVELWEAAQKRAAEAAPMSLRNSKNFYLLGRRIRCQCGKSMYGKDDHGTLVYHCGGRDHSAAIKCSVVQKDVDAPLIEPIVWRWLAEQLKPETLKDGLLDLRVVVEVEEDGARWANVTCKLAADRLLLQKIASTSSS